MSPEQARGQKVGPASDVFSLGCVLAFAALGHSPFGQGPAHAIAYRIVHEEADLSGLPAPLADLVGACLTKDPDDRPVLEQVVDRLTALTPAGEGIGQGRWLPEPLTQVIAERRTRMLTAVDLTATGESPTRVRTPAPPPSGPGERPRPLVSHERGRGRAHPADAYRNAVYVLLALFCLSSVAAVAYLVVFRHVGSWPVLVIQFALFVGLVAAWLLWFLRVRIVAERFEPAGLRHPPLMAVLGWFIPVGNLFLPKMIANDVWHASSRPGTRAPAGVLHAWWTLCLITFLTWPVLWRPWILWEVLGYRGSWWEVEPPLWTNLAMHVLAISTAVLTALYVHRLTALQAAKLAD